MRLGRLAGIKHSSSYAFGGSGGWELPPFWTNEGVRDQEQIDTSFAGYVSGAYKANGVVFACIQARMLVFSEARFQYQRFLNGRPGELFGDASLSILERPWPNGTTGELLARMEQDTSLAGNFFATIVDDRDGRRIRRLRPDWVTIVTGSRSGDGPTALDARVVGYMYEPQEGVNRPDPVLLLPETVAHWSPIPDPEANWRGMSWLQPIVREIQSDTAATKHKLKFFENGTVGSLAVTYDKDVPQAHVEAFAKLFKDAHGGTDNAYKTYHMGGGADVTTVGTDLKQLDFKVTQGAGETRIAAAAGVGAVIAQLSEGLQGSSLNSGNFTAARRRFADMTIQPLWKSAAAALETFSTPPAGARLTVDPRDIPFLQEDELDEAEIHNKQASTISALIMAGFTPDAVVAAVTSGDLEGLVGSHTGLYSVQLQPPGTGEPPPPEAPKADPSLVLAKSVGEAVKEMARSTTRPVSAPVINVTSPPVTNHFAAPPEPVINVDARTTVEPAKAADVTVNVPEQRGVTKSVTYDASGNIATITEEPNG